MQVHEIVYDAALEVVFDLVDDDLFSHVDELDICEVFLVFVNCFIDLFVVSNSIAEVFGGFFRVLTLVVW